MSGRIRTVKPEWLEDELLAAASDEARVLSVALLLLADDYGRGRASVATIAAHVWRYQMGANDGRDAHEIIARASRAFRELLTIRFVAVYQVGGQSYFAVRNWSKHQRVDRPGKPLVPEPPDDLFSEQNVQSREPREGVANVSREARESLATDLDLRSGPGPTTARGARAPVREVPAMAEARAHLDAFEARCEAVRVAVDRECRAVRRSPPPPACNAMSPEVTGIARWLSTAGEVDVDAMVRRWAHARDRKGGWAPLRWLSNDPTEYAFPAPSESAVRLTSEQEEASIEDFISAGTRRAEAL